VANVVNLPYAAHATTKQVTRRTFILVPREESDELNDCRMK